MKNKNERFEIYGMHILVIIFTFMTVSCGLFKDKSSPNIITSPEATFVDNVEKNDDKKTEDDTTNQKKNKESLSITDAYIMPEPLHDIFFNTLPESVSKRTNPDEIINTITKELVNSEEELYKYLDQKKQYATTNIFDKIP